MTKHAERPGRAACQPVRLPMEGPPFPPVQLDASGLCDSYDPGHQLHYEHQARAATSAPRTVTDTLVEGTELTLQLEDGDELTWSNHDPGRLRRILELVHGQGAAYPQFHALRIGPYWFNCATETDAWHECRLSRPADRE
jgi:hypothetical protein